MVCPACGLMNYPRVSPSMFVAVTKGDELLMARGHHSPPGLEITNIRYHSSQPCPFPLSIMIGFTADYAGGSCGRARCPNAPQEISIR